LHNNARRLYTQSVPRAEESGLTIYRLLNCQRFSSGILGFGVMRIQTYFGE